MNIYHLLIILILAGMLYVVYLYANAYKKLLEAIGPQYTSLNPNLVYLIYVPIVGLVFYFVLAFALKTSMSRLYEDGRITIKADAVFKSLLAFCVCTVLTVVPWIDQFMALAALICGGFNWWHAINTRKLVLMVATR